MYFLKIWLHLALVVAHGIFIEHMRSFTAVHTGLSSCGTEACRLSSCFPTCGIIVVHQESNLHPRIARLILNHRTMGEIPELSLRGDSPRTFFEESGI